MRKLFFESDREKYALQFYDLIYLFCFVLKNKTLKLKKRIKTYKKLNKTRKKEAQ